MHLTQLVLHIPWNKLVRKNDCFDLLMFKVFTSNRQ